MGQIAQTAGMTLPELVRRLQEAGMRELTTDTTNREEAPPAPASAPEWADDPNVRFEIDADNSIAANHHPLGRRRAHLQKLAPGEVIRLASSFYPAPLIDVLRREGIQTYTVKAGPKTFRTFVRKRRTYQA
jgi:uncharacterized protein (DUF2249 family)